MDRNIKIDAIMAFTRNRAEVIRSIPIGWWITNPQGVADRLNAYNEANDLTQRFTAEGIGRKEN